MSDYASVAEKAELTLARTVQHHVCSKESCLKATKHGIQCKRRAPFDLSSRDYVDELGNWGPKRTYAYINSWNPAIMQCMHSNQDIKLITSGAETIDISFYISLYVVKRQSNSSNASALLAKKLAFHKHRERYNSDTARLNKRLLQRCANTLSREQEFSAPEVISYLMAWGDRFISHFFTTIYWSSVCALIKKTYPDMKLKQHKTAKSKSVDTDLVSSETDFDIAEDVSKDDTVQIASVAGTLQIKDQLKEYVDCGDALNNMSLLQFCLDTYETDEKLPSDSGRGRKPKERIPYLEGTGHGRKCRVIKGIGHETMPNFVGDWFPRNDVSELQDFYHISMLALLAPWRDIRQFKQDSHTLAQAFGTFLRDAPPETHHILDNIQYHHECSDSARKKRQTQNGNAPMVTCDEDESEDALTSVGRNANDETLNDIEFTQRDIENNLAAHFSADDRLFAEVALNIALDNGVFKEDTAYPKWKTVATPATSEQLEEFQVLEHLIDGVTKNRIVTDNTADLWSEDMGRNGDSPEHCSSQPSFADIAKSNTHSALNQEQGRAHNIIMNHTSAYLEGRRPPQLLMMVIGQAGTGKSTLLNAITTSFQKLNAPQLLAKTALSGVAASLIGGTTLHWFAGLPPQKIPQSDVWPTNSSKHIIKRRTKNLLQPLWLAIDEAGMCTLDLLTLLSQVCGQIRTDDGSVNSTVPFGGLNILLINNFHQFPPVAGDNVALYCPPIGRQTAAVGKAIYLQFETVVKLQKQQRIEDDVWMDILSRLREGECTERDLYEVRKLIITNPRCVVPDFNTQPWNKAILITLRNCVRVAWNRASLRRHCRSTGELLYVFDAEDTVGNDRTPTNMEQKAIITGLPINKTKKLPYRLEAAIGMDVMVTLNIATEADLANGSRGKIKDIILDHREQISDANIGEDGVVWLQYPPAMILFKPIHHEFDPFPGLEPGLIPLFPSEYPFNIGYRRDPSTRVIRRQYAISPAYAFTDHKGQGQTIEYVIVDIGKTVSYYVCVA